MGQLNPQHVREFLLANTPNAQVCRELWNAGEVSYTGLRAYLLALKARQSQPRSTAAASVVAGGPVRQSASFLVNLPPTAKYSFDGVQAVFDDSKAAVTCVAFATLRSDMLAFANQLGEMWLVTLHPSGGNPQVVKASGSHHGAIISMCFSFDNSQLLSTGEDGALVVWRLEGDTAAAAAAASAMRSIFPARDAFMCGRLHKLNPGLALVGTSGGALEVYNCSTGTLHSRHQVAGRLEWGLQVTALDCSNHHIFCGDSNGVLHLHRCEVQHKQLSGVTPRARLSLVAAGQPPCPITSLEYVPFCRITDTPVAVATLRDGSIVVVKVHEARNTLELHLRRALGPASRWRPQPALCPLSCIQDVPLITAGSDDTNVYIYDLSVTGGSGAAAARGGAHAAQAAAAAARPMTVTVLKAHRAPAISVAWAYDESLLASGDADGTVVIWRRTQLFG